MLREIPEIFVQMLFITKPKHMPLLVNSPFIVCLWMHTADLCVNVTSFAPMCQCCIVKQVVNATAVHH